MKRFSVLFLSLFLTLTIIEVDARFSSSRSSSFSSGSRSSFGKSSVSKPSRTSSFKSKSSSIGRTKSSSGLFKKSSSTKPKAVSTNRIDKKRQKALAAKDKTAFRKYSSKTEAQKAYRKKMIQKNRYESPTPPDKRPEYIPQNVTINNSQTQVSYGQLPGGGYGYGYQDPMTNTFTALAAYHILTNDSHMRNAGYGRWDESGKPVVVEKGLSAAQIFLIVILIAAGVGVVIFIVMAVKNA